MTPTRKRCVCIESPFAGDIDLNLRYADACMLDALNRGEATYLGHLLYPRVLDDANPGHRMLGIAAHVSWLLRADCVVVYQDLGISEGMELAIKRARFEHIEIEPRSLGPRWIDTLAANSGTLHFR